MGNGWRIQFEAVTVVLRPAGGGNFIPTTFGFGVKPTPAAGSTMVITSIRPNLVDDATGSAPITPGAASQPATLELIGRAKPATPTGATPWVSLGNLKG